MGEFNYKEYLKNNPLTKKSDKESLNEGAPGFDNRKFGEPLPTLDSVREEYEASQAEEGSEEGSEEENGEKEVEVTINMDESVINEDVDKDGAELADMSNASQLIGKDFKRMVANFNSKGGDYDAWKEFKDDWLIVDRAIEIALEKGQE